MMEKDKWQEINYKKDIVVYVHGKGGNASEAEHYKQFFKEDVYGFDYKSENPWEAKTEFILLMLFMLILMLI